LQQWWSKIISLYLRLNGNHIPYSIRRLLMMPIRDVL